jgi:hypothetical protein
MHGRAIVSEALYEKLKRAEPTVAEAYKAAVKGNEIDIAALKAIMLKIVDPNGPKGGDISPEEAEALVLIIDSGELKPGTKTALLEALSKNRAFESILNGSGVELKPDDKELTSFHSVFAIKYTGNLKFYSKGTNLTYSPMQYQAVAQLVKDGKIKVVKVMDHGLSARSGADCMYVAPINTFFFFQHAGEADYFSHAPTIVHEATHAVQDWFDVPAEVTTRFVEADAYIAQATVDPNMQADAKLKAAADFVRKGTATKGNKAWEGAYEAVAGLIDKHPLYKARAADPVKMAEGKDEKTEFEKVIKALEQPDGAKSPPARKK